MTAQLTDPFILEFDEWVFLGADDVYALFDPKDYGLAPAAPSTACWKGFVVGFRVTGKQLYLDGLKVYCKDGSYPPINGVTPDGDDDHGMKVYNNIDLPLKDSGVVVIGKDMFPGERYRSFIKPDAFEKTLDLTFRDGLLTNIQDTSGTYSRF